MLKTSLRWLMAVSYVFAGVMHFVNPQPYLELMPRSLPWPLALVYLSGAAEILGGAGVLIPRIRRAAAWGLIALLVAVFPANLHAALHGFRDWPAWALWARLPLQAVLIAWVYWTCLGRRAVRT